MRNKAAVPEEFQLDLRVNLVVVRYRFEVERQILYLEAAETAFGWELRVVHEEDRADLSRLGFGLQSIHTASDRTIILPEDDDGTKDTYESMEATYTRAAEVARKVLTYRHLLAERAEELRGRLRSW